MNQIRCTQCGALMDENVAFCPNCGSPAAPNDTVWSSQPSQPAPVVEQPAPAVEQPAPAQPDKEKNKLLIYIILAVLAGVLLAIFVFLAVHYFNTSEETKVIMVHDTVTNANNAAGLPNDSSGTTLNTAPATQEPVTQVEPQRSYSSSPRYHVVVASYENYDLARSRMYEVSSMGYSATVKQARAHGRRVYRVVIGSYSSRSSAQSMASSASWDFPDAWVYKE